MNKSDYFKEKSASIETNSDQQTLNMTDHQPELVDFALRTIYQEFKAGYTLDTLIDNRDNHEKCVELALRLMYLADEFKIRPVETEAIRELNYHLPKTNMECFIDICKETYSKWETRDCDGALRGVLQTACIKGLNSKDNLMEYREFPYQLEEFSHLAAAIARELYQQAPSPRRHHVKARCEDPDCCSRNGTWFYRCDDALWSSRLFCPWCQKRSVSTTFGQDMYWRKNVDWAGCSARGCYASFEYSSYADCIQQYCLVCGAEWDRRKGDADLETDRKAQRQSDQVRSSWGKTEHEIDLLA